MTASDQYIAHLHRGSHRRLLSEERAETAQVAAVDALIVPAARPVAALDSAIKLAAELRCVLVVFCSQSVSPDEVLSSARHSDVSVVALDVDSVDPLPKFYTSMAVMGSRFERNSDVSLKRNLGLLLSRVAGWQRVLFVDDDIDGLHKDDVQGAAGMLDRYDIVGFNNQGYPDNSVVCHAIRDLGHRQEQFIGTGAVAVAPFRMRTFFPDVYNEDWFFFLGAKRSAVTGSMVHRWRSRAQDPERARQEELGDCMAEGIFSALGKNRPPETLDVKYWQHFLDNRRWLIERLVADSEAKPWVPRVDVSLEAAHKTCDALATEESDLCMGYIELWRSDLRMWQEAMDHVPSGLGITKALSELGWTGVARMHLAPQHEDRLIYPNGRDTLATGRAGARTLHGARQASSLTPTLVGSIA